MCVISKLDIYALENNILIQWMTQFAFKILNDARSCVCLRVALYPPASAQYI